MRVDSTFNLSFSNFQSFSKDIRKEHFAVVALVTACALAVFFIIKKIFSKKQEMPPLKVEEKKPVEKKPIELNVPIKTNTKEKKPLKTLENAEFKKAVSALDHPDEKMVSEYLEKIDTWQIEDRQAALKYYLKLLASSVLTNEQVEKAKAVKNTDFQAVLAFYLCQQDLRETAVEVIEGMDDSKQKTVISKYLLNKFYREKKVVCNETLHQAAKDVPELIRFTYGLLSGKSVEFFKEVVDGIKEERKRIFHTALLMYTSMETGNESLFVMSSLKYFSHPFVQKNIQAELTEDFFQKLFNNRDDPTEEKDIELIQHIQSLKEMIDGDEQELRKQQSRQVEKELQEELCLSYN